MLSTELQPTYVSIDCPQCKKNYLVATKSLAPGQARFQCTSCSTLFGLNWMGGETEVKTFIIEKVKHTQKCYKCGYNYEEGAKECPQCLVVFYKEAKSKAPIRTNIKEVEEAWQKAKLDYSNQQKHEEFIKLSVNHDQLAYASYQYRAILLVNPHDEMAIKMQKIISGLVETKTMINSNSKKTNIITRLGFTKVTVFICMFSMLLGFSFSSLRALVALGTSILFSILLIKYWGSNSEV